jgi:hypothetical protein
MYSLIPLVQRHINNNFQLSITKLELNILNRSIKREREKTQLTQLIIL